MTKQAYATQYIRYPLDRHVLAVASINHAAGDWSAYIGGISSIDYGDEWRDVVRDGTKVPRPVAEIMFASELEPINAERLAVKQKPLKWRG